ncbi:MAG: hypothetical protein ACRDUV_25660, partial [Pseudonocardiaceae bacterium]
NGADSNGYREGGHGVAWQDELRQLGEEMAAGRISADEYRRRFDELTAQGSAERGATPPQDNPPQQNQTPEQDSAPEQDSPPEQDPRDSPFPPAFKWDNTPNETTQVIQPVGDGDAESTQIVPAQPPPGPSYDDSERTQVVQAGPPGPPRYGQPTYSSGGFPGEGDQWSQQESAPPWVSSDPIQEPIQEPNAGWMMQGPEFFEPEPKESNVMRIVAIAAAVVVLVGIAFGAWFLFGRGGPSVAEPQQTTQQQTPPATTTQPPVDPLAPADVGGIMEFKQVTSFEDVVAAAFLTTEEEDDLKAAGAAQSRLLVTNFSQGKATILVTQLTSPGDAATARQQLASLQVDYGFAPRTAPPGVESFERLDNADDPPLLRGLYVSRDLVVRIEMRGNAPGDDPAGATAEFERILTQQLEKLPSDA